MLTQEQSVEIKVLARQGQSIKSIARELGLSRNTVRKYLRGKGTQPSYTPRAPRPCKLDPFKDCLQHRIEAVRPHWIPATVLLREIQERGYGGGISQLKAYLAPFKRTVSDRYEGTRDVLINLYPMLSDGGYVIVDDYKLEGCRRTVDEFRVQHRVFNKIQICDEEDGVVYWKKETSK
jgi:predicted transcriptional regulator